MGRSVRQKRLSATERKSAAVPGRGTLLQLASEREPATVAWQQPLTPALYGMNLCNLQIQIANCIKSWGLRHESPETRNGGRASEQRKTLSRPRLRKPAPFGIFPPFRQKQSISSLVHDLIHTYHVSFYKLVIRSAASHGAVVQLVEHCQVTQRS